jgi:hypothetical protein
METAQSMASLRHILGPAWGGYTFGSFGLRWLFVSAGLLMAAAFLLSLKGPANRLSLKTYSVQ